MFPCQFLLLGFLLLPDLVVSAPTFAPNLEERASPSIATDYGTWVGSSSGGIDSFLGIPFAQPPVGNLRFKAPVAPNVTYGTYSATSYGPSCPQMISLFSGSFLGNLLQDVLDVIQESPIFNAVLPESEDCLTINVFRPSTATPNSKLPVMFWIFGGAFELGGTSMYPGTGLVQQSIAMGEPTIFVSVNYRVNAFGFLPGVETVANGGAINAGLLDQRLGMKWVQKYISLFGGDPTKVTIFGESAGAISVGFHLIANNGNNEGLFRAAIMESGSAIPVLDASGGQNEYDALAAATGCKSASNSFSCLQNLPFNQLLNGINTLPFIFAFNGFHLPFLPRVDGTFITDEAQNLFAAGKYAKVPIITGDQYDEGTLLTLGTFNATTDADVDSYLQTIFPGTTEAIREGVLKNYPEDITQGSPFDTGIFNAITPQNKRISAIMGDIVFQAPRRVTLQYLSKTQPAWGYSMRVLSATPLLGTFHGSDLLFLFGLDPLSPSTELQTRWISFANNLNPNPKSGGYRNWPTWNISQQLLEFTDTSTNIVTDNFRISGTNFVISNITSFAF